MITYSLHAILAKVKSKPKTREEFIASFGSVAVEESICYIFRSQSQQYIIKFSSKADDP